MKGIPMSNESAVLLRSSPWTFDKDVAHIFDAHVRQSVPGYDELHRMVCELSDLVAVDGPDTVCDLGTSTGEAICNLSRWHTDKSLTFYAYDESEPMLDAARMRCKDIPRVHFVHERLETAVLPTSSLILSIYTLMFIATEHRRHILGKAFNALTPGGALVLAEKLVQPSTYLNHAFAGFHEQLKMRNGLSQSHIDAKRQALVGVLEPLSLDQNLAMLKEAGFIVVDVFFRWYNFVGIFAMKPI